MDGPSLAFRWRGTGTFTGRMDPPGYAPTNGRIDFTGFDLHEYREGRLSRLVILFDNAEVGRRSARCRRPDPAPSASAQRSSASRRGGCARGAEPPGPRRIRTSLVS